MNRFAPIAIAALAASCNSERTIDFATLDGVSYAVPTGWNSRPLSDHRIAMVEWIPEDNDAKESVTITRTSPRPAIAKAGAPQIERLLAQAQTSLPKGTFAAPSRLRTEHGFMGARLEGTFVPSGQTEPYQRIHGVFVDGDALVHVVYTAKVPDREVFEIVVNSLTRKAG
jgi:hypothetical protein